MTSATRTAADDLLSQIVADPLGDDPRWELACVLEDESPLRARLIRLGIDLATKVLPDAASVRRWCLDNAHHALKDWEFVVGRKYGVKTEATDYEVVAERSVASIRTGGLVPAGMGRKDSLFLPPLPISVENDRRWARRVRRGFIEEVEMKAWEFMHVARDLFKGLPVLRVRLTDVHPYEQKSVTSFGEDGPVRTVLPQGEGLTGYGDLLAPLTKHMPVGPFRTRRGARRAVSDACVRYGREVAGLPPLKEQP